MRNRIAFLAVKGMPRAALAIALCGLLAPNRAEAQRPMATGGRFSLEVEGYNVGFLRAIEGGVPVGEVVTGAPGEDGFSEKHLGGVSYDDIVATVGMGMGKGMYEWLSSSFNGSGVPRKSGRVLVADFNGRAQSEQTFSNAFISAITIPTLDGSSKDAGYFTVRITPERVTFKKGAGQDIRAGLGAKQKAWLTSNFRLELGDLPTSRVARIDSFTITRKVLQAAGGAERAVTKMPAALEIPNLKLSISMADLAQWEQWRDSFLIQGNNTDANEKAGAIVFLGPDMKEELGRLTLDRCGLVRLAPDRLESNSERIARFTVELYCQKMGLSLKDADQ
ncbi:MAG TPA: phage tail protein [Gemmatimonadaceae bacterium]|nr:phage tail protein [Gemmatimonadaceae bacterium]